MTDFIEGIVYFFRGMRYLLMDGLKRFIVLPILFNFALFAGLFYLAYHFLFPYSAMYAQQLPAWLSFLNTVLWVILALSFFLIFLSIFTVLFNLVAAPFNGLLAEKTQNMIYNSKIPSLSFAAIAYRSIKRQGQFLLYIFPRFLGMVILFFVPFIQPIYPFLWFAFNAWVLSIQYQDFAMDNNLISFKKTHQALRKEASLTLGFGSIINFLSFIPVVNIIIMPAAVIGSVLIFCEKHQNRPYQTLIKAGE